MKKTNIKDDHIVYARKKTMQTVIVKIEEPVREIIDRYYDKKSMWLFSFLMGDSDRWTLDRYQAVLCRYNSLLKVLAALAGVKKRAKPGKKIVCLMSGGNIDVVTISSIINQGLISRGRIMCFSVELPDKPGQLVKVATLLAENGANVIELQHNQFKAIDRYSNKVVLEVTVETNGHEHIKQILEVLEDNNFIPNRIY